MTTKQTLTVEVMTLRARIAELEAQLSDEREALRATCELARDRIAPHHIAPIITRFTKADGTQWIKTRVGNRAVSRQVLSN